MNIVDVGYKSTHYYMIADRQPRLLVDAGWAGTLPQFQQQCQRAGVELTAIPYVFVTHFHPDHAGLAQELKAFGCKLIVADVQAAAIPLLKGMTKPQDRYLPIEPAGNISVPLADSRAFLKGIGIDGVLIHTPGHSDDSVTLVLDDGSAFTGDLTAPFLLDETMTVARASWDALRAAGAATIYPGHGPARHLDT